MKKNNYILIIASLMSLTFSQSYDNIDRLHYIRNMGMISMPFPQMGENGRKNERMEMMMTWKLTNDLDLNTEQADKFFPRFKEHRENMGKFEKEILSIADEMKNKIDSGKDISQKEFDKSLEAINQMEIKKIEEKERFIKQMSEFLTIKQLAKLTLYKHYFMKDLRKEIRKRPRGGA